MDNFYGIKELYEISLKATYPMEINGINIEQGETFLTFDSILIGGLVENNRRWDARGGWDNRAHVTWETLKDMPFNFTQGIFSKRQFAVISNSKIFNLEKDTTAIELNKTESFTTDENGQFVLTYTPAGKVFVYTEEAGEKLPYTINEKTVTVDKTFTNVFVNYTYNYINGGSIISFGNKLITGYIALEAKTRLKDDKTGQTVTGIFKIPKLKLTSDLSMRLGRDTNPATVHFSGVGVPVGTRGNSHACELIILNDDIDSDL